MASMNITWRQWAPIGPEAEAILRELGVPEHALKGASELLLGRGGPGVSASLKGAQAESEDKTPWFRLRRPSDRGGHYGNPIGAQDAFRIAEACGLLVPVPV